MKSIQGGNAVQSLRFASIVLLISFSESAFSGGFEKSSFWSGRFAGIGGAASASADGADALFFNPAGLSLGNKTELSINTSPTFSKFSGPVATATPLESSMSIVPVYGLGARYKVNDKFGIGFGAAIVAGADVTYENVDFSKTTAVAGANAFDTLKPTLQAKLAVHEVGFGAGYEVLPGFRLGGSYRITIVRGALQSAALQNEDISNPADPKPSALVAVNLANLSAVSAKGYRLGAQFTDPTKKFGLGADFRSSVAFTANATSSGTSELGTFYLPSSKPVTGGDVTVGNELPLSVNLAGFVNFGSLTIFPGYTFTRYSADKNLDIAGSITLAPDHGSLVVVLPSVAQNWKNQSNYRLGAEWEQNSTLRFRAGYVYTYEAVNPDYARETFSAPGRGKTYALGVGLGSTEGVQIDATAEYNDASGTGTSEFGQVGTFTTKAYVGHLSARFRF